MHPALLLAPLTFLAAAPGPEHAVAPGHERFFAGAMPARPGELPEGWTLRRLTIPRDRVEALYAPDGPTPTACRDAPLCVEVVHPDAAGPEDTVAGRFAVRAHARQADASGLVAGLARRLAAPDAPDPWKRVSPRLPEPRPPPAGAETVPADTDDAGRLAGRFAALLDADAPLRARLLRTDVAPEVVRYHLRDDRGAVAHVTLRDRPPRLRDPSVTTRSFFVQALGGLTDPPDLAQRVRRAVADADDGSLRLQPSHALAARQRPPLHTLLVVLSALLLGVLVLGTPWLYRAAARALRGHPLAWAFLAAGAALRLALPGRLVEMGIGYHLTTLAEQLLLPRYGAGTTTLHHAVFQLTGADHDVMLWTHKVLGVLTLPLAAAVGARLLAPLSRDAPHAVTAWAAALALTPMLLRSDLTESNLVPVLWTFFAAILAWQALTGPLRVALTAAGLGFAALSRPEMVAVAPLAWLALSRPWRAPRPALAVAALLAAVVPWQVAFVADVAAWETSTASLHLGDTLTLSRLWGALGDNALLDPRIVPAAVPLLALGALALRPARRAVALWLLGGLAWLYIYAIDLSPASMPRLHVVALLPWSLAAAAATGALLARHRAAGLAAAALWLGTAAATVPTLWAPTNEDTDQHLYDRVRASLPARGGYVLAVVTHADAPDPPGGFTHRHVPRYRFRDGDVIAISALPDALNAEPARPVLYFQGAGCYARLGRPEDTPPGPLPACAAVHARFHLEPVWTERIPNRGNPVHQELGYYGDEPAFDVGLWRVIGPR